MDSISDQPDYCSLRSNVSFLGRLLGESPRSLRINKSVPFSELFAGEVVRPQAIFLRGSDAKFDLHRMPLAVHFIDSGRASSSRIGNRVRAGRGCRD
ncbi:MAG: hypothetical protein IPF49_18755 [Gammaproteobacteria bacterium]|nr:hypothetical protein [Gammaproteobacteria bacterium]